MRLVCYICKTLITSNKLELHESVPDVLNTLQVHVQHRHPEQYKELMADIEDIQLLVAALPGYLLIDHFVDPDDGRTAPEFTKVASELQDGVNRLLEILEGPEDGDETNTVTDVDGRAIDGNTAGA